MTFSTPGVRAPDEELNDEDLIDSLKRVIEERTDLSRQVLDAKEQLKVYHQGRRESSDAAKKLKTAVEASQVSGYLR